MDRHAGTNLPIRIRDELTVYGSPAYNDWSQGFDNRDDKVE